MFPEVYTFLDNIFSDLKEKQIDISTYQLDHICYRVNSIERYQELKESLSVINKLLIESEVGGRLISTFKLTHPVHFRGHIISCLELPSPKNGSSYTEGYEHVEFVISESFDEFMQKYKDLEFKTGGMSKDFNPELKVKLSNGLSVKFHHLPLEKVIEIELAESNQI